MNETIRLQYHYYDYDFVVTRHNLLDPDDSPCIALRRIRDNLIVGYTNYSKFVGTKPGDASHMDRLEAAAALLSHFLLHAERFGIQRLSEIPTGRIKEYLYIMCSDSEGIYAGEFVYNLAKAGYLIYVEPMDLIITRS